MRFVSLTLAAALLATAAVAQGTGGPDTRPPGTTRPSDDGNEAVATGRRDGADRPARGANSFSEGQARDRIADRGFQNVSNLRKDDDGIWHGTATKDGKQVSVWLDYKGEVGQQQ